MTGLGLARTSTQRHLDMAVRRAPGLSRTDLLDRAFARVFNGLVYPQIWEDPRVDMEALRIGPGDHVVAIASGGCNVLSYLAVQPTRITAVDLNGAHVALLRLKLCALENLPDHAAFFRFFGRANQAANLETYERLLRPHLDPDSRAYWDGRDRTGRRRITRFTRNFYRYGLLGTFIGIGHAIARIHGVNPRELLRARTLEEQRAIFDSRIAPLFDAPLIRWLTRHPASLYGLGIPPAQFDRLSAGGPTAMAGVLRQRLEQLACGFPLADNYFAWQAFGRGYAPEPEPAVPPYLERRNFARIRAGSSQVRVQHRPVTEVLAAQPAASVDKVVLLDAQDWMTDTALTALWSEITRTARPGARVVFRTAGEDSVLPGRVPAAILSQWQTDPAEGRAFLERDRSGIYGGFHLYVRVGK